MCKGVGVCGLGRAVASTIPQSTVEVIMQFLLWHDSASAW